jgi:mannitol/fructose-specific phosphotransferase system IIA component (Ntr-type)
MAVGFADAPGLVFNPAAGANCRVFFLIAIPAFAPTAHLTLLQHLVHFTNDAKRMEKLLACQTAAQVSNCIVTFKWKP